MAEGQEESTKAKNKVTIEEVGPCKKKVIIEVPQETIAAASEEQYETLRKEVAVPGFRKGRAPRRLLEKKYGKETCEQIKLKLLADASEVALKDNDIDVLRDPDVDYQKIELPESGPMKFEFEVEVRPEFKLPKLEGIAVTKTKFEVTKEQIDGEIEQLRTWSGAWAPRGEGAKVEVNDQIIANALLKVEGVEEGEKLDNTEIYVRKSSFVGAIPVDELDGVMVGAKVGDTKKTNVEVPKTYFKEEYRGKKIDIAIEVKDIKWLKPADINKDFFGRFGVENETELRERIKDNLSARLEQQSMSDMGGQISKYLLDNTKFELPTDIVADQATMLLQRQYANLLKQGLAREQLEEQMEKLKSGSEEQAKEQLKSFFIMDKVAEKLEISVTDEEINGHIAQLAVQRGQRPERLREDMQKDGSLSQFSLQIREDKSISKILETAKITEVAPKKTAKKTTSTKKTTKKTVKKAETKEKTPKKTKKKVKKAVKKKTGK